MPFTDHFKILLVSRTAMGVSPKTLLYYRERLSKFLGQVNYRTATRKDIEQYLNTIPPNQYGLSTRHASFGVIKIFYRWLNAQYGLPNPIFGMPAPILGKPILPSLSRDQVQILIDTCPNVRDKAIIALLTESGLRLSELVNIRPENIDWATNVIRVMGKGRKEAYAPFGQLTERYLKEWIAQNEP